MAQNIQRNWLDSLKAAAIHFFLSIFLIGGVSVILFKVWYPNPLAIATGMLNIFTILFIVNLLSGPLLTLIVYKKGKQSLLFDLIIIVFIQLSALAYGMYSLAQARPVWLTFYNNRFEVVRLNDIEDVYLEKSSEKYKRMSLTGPTWVAAKPTGTEEEIKDLALWNRMGAKIVYQPAFYYPIKEAYAELKNKAYDFSKLEAANHKVTVNAEVKANPDAVGWLPLWGQKKHMVVFINQDGIPIKIVDLRPWTRKQMSTSITTKTEPE